MHRTPIVVALALLTACGSPPAVNAPIAIPTPDYTSEPATPRPDLTGVPAITKTRQPNMLATLIADATRITVLPYSAKLNGAWQHHQPDYRLMINLSIGEISIQQQGIETLLPVALDSETGKTVVLKIIGRDRSYTFRFVTDDIVEWDDNDSNIETLTRVTQP